MGNGMQQHFPVIRDRETVLNEIRSRNDLREIFEGWKEQYREEFLDICTGVRGMKMLYDTFFKEIMNPDIVPERLEEVLSLILKIKVKILKVLPNDSARIAAENSLLVLDIVVQLEDGSIANVEVQKIGYKFPGQRSACYSADLLLRQYKRVRGEKGDSFKYQDIKKVYTIVFLERSTKEFRKFTETYIHRGKQTFDTGLELELLQEYVFVALDIFHQTYHNKVSSKRNKFEAWLTFLSDDDPEEILRLLQEYPEFERLYQEAYEMCRNMENFMRLFSKELEQLDKNTVQYMIDELQEEVNEKTRQLEEEKEKAKAEREKLEVENAKLRAELQRLTKGI